MSLGLVTARRARPPTTRSTLRSAWVTLAPITVWMTLVSVVARQHLARAGHLEEAGRQMEDVTVDVAPQVGHDALAQPGDQIGAQVGRDRQGHDDNADSLDRMVERAGVALGKAAVDQIAQADAQGEHGGGGEDEGESAPMTWPRYGRR